jgi:hypothetical protein
MYDFVELLAPHLPKKFVRKAEQMKTQEQLDQRTTELTIPYHGIEGGLAASQA